MRFIITGFTNSGKTTVFNALTGLNIETTAYPTVISAETEPHIGTVKAPDSRLDRLSSIYKPRKTIYAVIEYIDYPGISPASSAGGTGQNTKVFNLIKESDAIVHVVRAFEDEAIIHPLGDIDPVRDAASFETEFILGDLEFIEKRLERMEEAAQKGKKQDEADRHLLLKCKEALEDEISLRNIEFNEGERLLMLPYQFVSTMPEIIVLNIDEKDINTERVRDFQGRIESYFRDKAHGAVPPVVPLCGKMEMEIVQLSEDERQAFLDEMGIKESAMKRLCRVSYNALGLISFFTIGKDEIRAWTIKSGTSALKAAGRVHSDMERGFIRAEVICFDDFISSEESMVTAKEKGLVRLEGKGYVVKDGDIINFKFNV